MKKNILGLLIVLSFLLLTACSTTVDPSDAYKGETPRQIFSKGTSALRDKNYGEAIKRFEALDVQYPFVAETQNAQLYLIYAYYMKEDYALSVATADRFIRMYPTHPHVDYAFYMRGVADYYLNMGALERVFTIDLAKRDLTQMQKTYYDFNELVLTFPNSVYTPSARQYMIYLRNLMARHELQVGEYYYDRKAYMAAANRGAEVVTHYQGSPSVIDALVLMARSYNRLGMLELRDDTLAVLRLNYPNKKVNLD